jgi:hypothetical protein
MQAIEIEAQIDENGEIHIKLPQRRPPGTARVIVLFDTDQDALENRAEANDFAGIWADLPDADFDALLRETEERRRGAFATRPSR